MGAICCWSTPTDRSLLRYFSNSSQTAGPTRVSGAFCGFKKFDDIRHWSVSRVSAAGQECFRNLIEIREFSLCSIGNGPRQRSWWPLRNRRWSTAGGALSLSRRGVKVRISGWHAQSGSNEAGLVVRFKSLSDLNDIKSWASPCIQSQSNRKSPNLSGKRYIHKCRVRCAARRGEDGERQARRYSQEVDVVDHYKMLGLSRRATASGIKSAFRQLAHQFHPDVNKDVDANEKFKAILLAYEVLSDEASRKLYDNTLQDRVRASRKNQVKQRRERDTSVRSHHNRSQNRRAPYDNVEWSYSVHSYDNEYSNMESFYPTYPSTGPFSYKKRKPARNSDRGKSREEEIRQEDWQLERQSMVKEALLFLWVVSAIWHALGVKTALGLLVGSMALWRDFAVGYRLASGVAWLMGGVIGLAFMVALVATTRVFGRAYHTEAAILALGLWVGSGVLKAVPLPHGAILLLVYKCIQLPSKNS